MNHDVKGRYFSRIDFSPNTSPDYFEVPKQNETFRIFCLGGSTTVGYPYSYVGSFSTFLRDRLKGVFPDKKIEIINLGMTATNSFTVVDIAKELVDYEPDLLIVYDGHNEFYGALGIASHESIARSRWFTKFYLDLIHFRSFQLFRNNLAAIMSMFGRDSNGEHSGTMMERLAKGQYIPYRSEIYNKCLQNFTSNLEELRSICALNTIALFVSSQVSNLKDQPPFVSELPESNKFQIDPVRADPLFRNALELQKAGKSSEALLDFIHARDLDLLRFRASSDFNSAIRVLEGGLVSFVDIEQAFKVASPDSLIGSNLILEHLHPNARGYFLIAKEYAYTMRQRGLLASTEEWAKCDTIADGTIWNQRPLTELDNRCASRRTELLMSGWPFKSITQELPPIPSNDTLGLIAEEVVRGRMSWERGHVEIAGHYSRRNENDKAAREYRTIINQIPLSISAYQRLARIYLRDGRNDKAAEVLLQSLEAELTVYAYNTLGKLAELPDEATPFFKQALTLSRTNQEKSDNGYLLADAYARAGKTHEAIAQLQQVLMLNPSSRQASELLHRLSISSK